MEWIDGNLGAKTTMKYPSVFLQGQGARGTMLSIAFAGKGQNQDTGAKMIHNAPNTSSSIVSKSIAKDGGEVNYRGQVLFAKNSKGSISHIECDTIIMDQASKSDTIPFNEIHNGQVALEHEAKVSRISEEQLFYLMSRGLSEGEATEMIVMGFVEPFTKELPMEYAVELNRLIAYEMEGSAYRQILGEICRAVLVLDVCGLHPLGALGHRIGGDGSDGAVGAHLKVDRLHDVRRIPGYLRHGRGIGRFVRDPPEGQDPHTDRSRESPGQPDPTSPRRKSVHLSPLQAIDFASWLGAAASPCDLP